jgi:predicted Fe-S protein YdhL (DUF1289 family)
MEDICLGCFRSLDEIIQWSNATALKKEAIIIATNARKLEHKLKYGYLNSGNN